MGDQAVYANFEQSDGNTEWKRVDDSGFRVAAAERIVDRFGRMHEVVSVYLGTQAGTMQNGMIGGQSTWGYNHTVIEYVDLPTGRLLGSARDGVMSTSTASIAKTQQAYHELVYGPQFDATTAFGSLQYPGDANLVQQGMTFRVGQTIDREAVELLSTESLLYAGWWGPQFGNLTYREGWVKGSVTAAAAVGGVDALDEHFSGCIRFELGPDRNWPFETAGMWFLGVKIPIPSKVCFEIDRWITGASPYPVLEERHLLVNGTQPLASLSALAGLRAGGPEIQWGRGALNRSLPTEAFDRSPRSQRFPADGSSATYGFRLADAKAGIEADATLLTFQRWRAGHPDGMLIGAQLTPTGEDLSGRRWSLVYGTPDGAAFVAQSERARPTAPASNSEIGEMAGPPFKVDMYPPGPLTLAAGVALYEKYVDPAGVAPANAVTWGYRYVAPTVFVWGAPASMVRPPQIYGTYTNVGHSDETPPPRQAPSLSAVSDLDASRWIMYNDTTGELWWSRQTTSSEPYTPLASPLDLAPPTPIAAGSGPGAPRPDLRAAALVSGSFLALVLCVYFFPLLKWAGGSLVVFTPGYAKLHRSGLLNNRVRDRIVHAVRADPGITPPRLQELTGAGWSTVVYHLRVLEKNKLVSSLIDGRHKRFFPSEAVNWNDRGRIAVLKNLKSRELYELVLEEPGVGPGSLAERVGITRPAVYWHTNRLEKAGLLGRDRAGFRTRFYANPHPVARYDARDAVEVT